MVPFSSPFALHDGSCGHMLLFLVFQGLGQQLSKGLGALYVLCLQSLVSA
jgi:hypothetical protein